jgi:hypothetical protein
VEPLKLISIGDQKMIELVQTVKTFGEVIRAAIRHWGGSEKQVYLELGIDGGNWTRMLTGKANFPPEMISKFCDIVQNDLVLHWLAYQRGFELRIIPKELEERLAQKDAELEELKKKFTYLESLFMVKKESVNV